LKPGEKKLIAIAPDRVFRIDDVGAARFIVDELRRNSGANNEIDEVMSVNVRLYLLSPEMKVFLAKLLRDCERELQRRSRISEKRRSNRNGTTSRAGTSREWRLLRRRRRRIHGSELS
jgi:hypothetical protein